MNIKFYISFEVAKLLKEKGCDIKRDFLTHVYKENGRLYWSSHEDLSNEIPAYTKDEVIDWLESKGVRISTHPVSILHEDGTTKTHWSCHITNDGIWYTTHDLPTRLEAVETAFIKVLIELL